MEWFIALQHHCQTVHIRGHVTVPLGPRHPTLHRYLAGSLENFQPRTSITTSWKLLLGKLNVCSNGFFCFLFICSKSHFIMSFVLIRQTSLFYFDMYQMHMRLMYCVVICKLIRTNVFTALCLHMWLREYQPNLWRLFEGQFCSLGW